MIVSERMTAYINSLDRGYPEYLERIALAAEKERIPVIRRETRSFLRFLMTALKPERILEIGTAVGFSALLMCEYAPGDCHITTIENDGKRILAARDHFSRAGRQERITLLPGDASEILEGLAGPFDFVFVDAAKGQYLSYLPHILRILAVGGILVSDNVLQEGDVIESRFAVERRDRTIHARMREYLYELTHCEELATSVLPLGDGVTVSVRR